MTVREDPLLLNLGFNATIFLIQFLFSVIADLHCYVSLGAQQSDLGIYIHISILSQMFFSHLEIIIEY